MLLHVLFEHAAGYALFAIKEVEEIGMLLPQVYVNDFNQAKMLMTKCGMPVFNFCSFSQVEESVLSVGKFSSVVKLAAFFPFKSAQAALENMNAISEGKFKLLIYFLVWFNCYDVPIICQSTELLC